MKNYTLMINKNCNSSWDYRNPNESIDQYKDLTKELLYILYAKEELYNKVNEFIILSNDVPLKNNELLELGLIDSNNNYLQYPNGKSDLLSSVMEYIESKKAIYIYGRFEIVDCFLVNLIANYSGKEKIAFFSSLATSVYLKKLNGSASDRCIFNRFYPCRKENYEILKEQISNITKDHLIIISGMRDYEYEVEIVHFLKENGYKFIICRKTAQDKLSFFEDIKDNFDTCIKLKERNVEDEYRMLDVYIEGNYYISYKFDERTRRVFEKDYLMINTISFSNVAGFSTLKDELIQISKWWKDYQKYKQEGIDLPRGILIYGESGNGKSLMAKAFINEINNCKIITIDDEDEILDKFELAKESQELVIIFMDELEYLYKKNPRDLLTMFDSLNLASNVFLVSTTNNLDRVEGPLTRRGRLDYLIQIGRPKDIEREEILKYYFSKCNVESELDYNYLSFITVDLTSAELKALVNDSILRYGKSLTASNIEEEVDRIRGRFTLYYGSYDDGADYMSAVHEIGHTIAVIQNQEYFTFYKTTLESNSRAQGLCRYIAKKEQIGNSKKLIADIDIALAGYLACKVLYNYDSTGCSLDLETARHMSAALINSYGYGGFNRILNHCPNRFNPSNEKMHQNELISEKILKESEKRVRKLIKKNKKLIITLANLLYEKKVITIEDIRPYL